MSNHNKLYTIYRHTSPSDKVYIGQTCQKVWVRWLHTGNGYKKEPIFWKAIKKYGWENIKHEILLEGLDKPNADYAETYLIRWYKLHKLSYNVTDGGEGGFGLIPWNKGIHTGYVPWNKGLTMPEYLRKIISDKKKGRKYGPQSKLHSLHKAEAHKIPIVQVDTYDPNLYKTWKSAKDAQDKGGYNRKAIGQCLRNKCVQSNGYFWFYLNDFNVSNYIEKQEKLEKARIHYQHETMPNGIDIRGGEQDNLSERT